MPLPLRQAAAELDIHPQTLRGWVRDGAPIAKRGGAGRGRVALYDVEAVRAWRDRSNAPDAALRIFAAEIPELMAVAVYQTFQEVDGPHKRSCAGALVGAWYAATTTLLDHLRSTDATIPELSAIPEKVSALREVFAHVGNVTPSLPKEPKQ